MEGGYLCSGMAHRTCFGMDLLEKKGLFFIRTRLFVQLTILYDNLHDPVIVVTGDVLYQRGVS